MLVAVVAEKPSVARDIAAVLGARTRQQGRLLGNGYVVTWAIGHLVALAKPDEVRPEWKRWTPEQLPLIPERWPLVVLPDTKAQYELVASVLCDASVESVVCATDAGREGELIFRYLYEKAGCRKPVSRLWLSSLTPEAIRQGFSRLRSGADFDPLADAARGRSRADWLVGMNLSRATTLAHGATLHVGRVQTPTLAMLVERERAIQAFVPEDYLEVQARFRARSGEYEGTFFRPPSPTAEAKRLPSDGAEARLIAARAKAGVAEVESANAETRRVPPPLLYDLTDLQRHANRLYGMSAKETLAAAQSLYEGKKLLSYPRTDSRHLSLEAAKTLPVIVRSIAGGYAGMLAPGTGERPLSKRFVDDAKVRDHHALLPTSVSPEGAALASGERRIYDLVCRRLLMAWHAEHVFSVTTLITRVAAPGAGAPLDRFHSSGTALVTLGWKALEPGSADAEAARAERTTRAPAVVDDAQRLPSGLVPGLGVAVAEATPVARRTRPPRRFTDATLLTAMETAGRTLDDRQLAEAMKESGLGTPATRADIIETLARRGYLVREGRSLAATAKGIALIDCVHPDVKSPALTGGWEAQLLGIERGSGDLVGFMGRIQAHVTELVRATLDAGAPGRPAPMKAERATEPGPEAGANTRLAAPAEVGDPPPVPLPEAAAAPERLYALLRGRFQLEAFRPRQEEVCRALAGGRDVLLVMPTGAGKSLCYQLPGLARGGPTVVISPLIALMEDQVAKLEALGLSAERVHSGRDRAASRQALARYVDGRLDFLFVAPERLAVPGFQEALARRTPALVAVDEAHCISEWGHDFRPDYRLLGERLPRLRPAPVIALTATATPRVQDDIAAQLGIRPQRFIHGFRRANIAIEVARLLPSRRPEAVSRLLADPSQRSAIVYTPTRREADALAATLALEFPAAAYHAGMPNPARERVQADFLAGRLEVIVATIAFGMGVDKPDIRSVVHTALPGTLEGFSQEIGRAGRDGRQSRAVLLHSWNDRRTHEFFHQKGYPEPDVLERVFRALDATPRVPDVLARGLRLGQEELETALEKLWIHGGARFSTEGGRQLVVRGADAWRGPYERQREHRREQLDSMQRFADGNTCRMVALVRHFGDQEDTGEACLRCDVCDPRSCRVRSSRAPRGQESAAAEAALEALKRRDGLATGRLHAECLAAGLERKAFEEVLGGLARAGLLRLSADSFVKDGRTIRFKRAWLTAEARTVPAAGTVFTLQDQDPPEGSPAPRRGKGKAAGSRLPRSPAVAAPELVASLKAWRLSEARRARVPAFRVLHDRTLLAIAAARPSVEPELLAVQGFGPALLKRYGERILALCRSKSAAAPRVGG